MDIDNFPSLRAISISSDVEILDYTMVPCESNLWKPREFPSSSVSIFSDFLISLPDNDNKFSGILPNTIAVHDTDCYFFSNIVRHYMYWTLRYTN